MITPASVERDIRDILILGDMVPLSVVVLRQGNIIITMASQALAAKAADLFRRAPWAKWVKTVKTGAAGLSYVVVTF